MTLARKMLIGGLSTLGISSLSLAAGVKSNDGQGIDVEEGIDINDLEKEDLIRRLGLECRNSTNDGSECFIRSGKKIKVIQGDKEEDSGLIFGESKTGKIKIRVANSEDYIKELRFSIEEGDIPLVKKHEDGEEAKVTLLSRFENYEIKRIKEKLYLYRKTTADEGRIMALGLPKTCLPEKANAHKECSIKAAEINDISFENKVTPAGTKPLKLKISKTDDSTVFKGGYIFTFESEEDITISGTQTIRANTKTDYTIKDPNVDKLTLERAWGEGSAPVGKVGLEGCGANESQCSIKDGFLNIRQGTETLTKGSGGAKQTPEGKIKVYREHGGYENGIKLVVEDGNIGVTTTPSQGGGISKLEEYETYEISRIEGGDYYLNRKTEAKETIKGAIGLPKNCNFPKNNEDTTCQLSPEDFKKINFDNRNSSFELTKAVKLTISKSQDEDTFKFGYRFSFVPEEDITISNNNKLKAKVAGDYGILRKSGTNLTLKRAWSDEKELIKKIGLECADDTCSITNNSLKIRLGNHTISNASKDSGGTQGIIRLQKDAEGYGLGLKFSIEDNDITITYGNNNKKKLAEYEIYEIKEFEGNYYLTRKTSFEESEKWKELGLPPNCTDLTKLKNQECGIYPANYEAINFLGRKRSETISAPNMKDSVLWMKKHEDINYPFGFKYILEANEGGNIKVPLDSKKIILWKHAKIPFKIVRDAKNGNRLALERDLDINKIAQQVGLKNCDDETGCTIGAKINIEDPSSGNKWAYDAKVVDSGNQKVIYKMDSLISSTKGIGIKFILKKNVKVRKSSIVTYSMNFKYSDEADMRAGLYEAEWRDNGSVKGLYLVRKGGIIEE